MAWLSGLAGKAETLLNKIDQNTAAVLNKDKPGLDTGLLEVKWATPEISTIEMLANNTQQKPENVKIPEVILSDVPQLDPQTQNTFIEIISTPKVPSVTPTENLNRIDSDSEVSVQSGHSSPSLTVQLVDSQIINKNADTLSDECNLDAANRLLHLQSEFKNYLASDECYSTMRKNFEGKNDLLNRQQTDYQKEINVLKEKLPIWAMEKKQLLREIADLKASLDRSRLELDSTRSDLEQHKVRASKILQEKEKLIAELRKNSSSNFDESAAMEINQLKQEKESLREENQQTSEQLKIARQELHFAETKLEKIKSQLQESSVQAQEMINVERRRRLDIEEDVRSQLEEVRMLKEELSTLRKNLSAKSLRQENEISRLRSQISAMSTPSSEIESRLTNLTQTLVSKQQALETLTTERNALRLQLEKIEQEYRVLGNARRNGSYASVNDTDDVKAQVPTFLVETPFDTGVARRVKRAYSTLDAISIRTGVFLRRYPLARILVFIYMAVLQFWVLVVLLSQSPDAH